MAFVTIADKVYVHRVDDLSDFVAIYPGSINEDAGVVGQVRRYANGVTRSVKDAGEVRRLEVVMPYLDRDDLLQLETYAGLPVMVRDPVGRKVFGVFFTVAISEQPIGDAGQVLSARFDLNQLTLSEEV